MDGFILKLLIIIKKAIIVVFGDDFIISRATISPASPAPRITTFFICSTGCECCCFFRKKRIQKRDVKIITLKIRKSMIIKFGVMKSTKKLPIKRLNDAIINIRKVTKMSFKLAYRHEIE